MIKGWQALTMVKTDNSERNRPVLDIPMSWAPSQYPKRRLSVRSPKVSKPRDRYFKLSYRFEIWQAHRQHCCRSACQISERSDNSKYKSRGFETLRDLTERRLFVYWDGALVPGDNISNYNNNYCLGLFRWVYFSSDGVVMRVSINMLHDDLI